ncbi:MAG TPA: signal peptide peptidase SppA, partial [Kofleriaceae bacterium]
MSRARFLVLALLAACANPSRLDHEPEPKPEPKARHDDATPGGFDLKSTLTKIAEGLRKPGPYEAPEASAGFDDARPHWGVLRLHGRVVERKAFSLSSSGGLELDTLTDRLRALAADPNVTGVLLRFDDLTISLTDAVELRLALHDVRKAGKQLACHADSAHDVPYLVMAACDRIGLAPVGDVMIGGPAAMPVHIKGLLDKLDVQADFLHVGAYKGAAEPLTRDAPSREMTETLGAILDGRYATMVQIIAVDRKLDAKAVPALIDTALFPSDAAKAAGLVDEVASFEAFRDQVRGNAAWTRLDLDPDKHDKLALIMRLSRFIGAMAAERPVGPHVALIYALGDIVNDDGDGVLGAREHVAAATLVPALHALAADASVKAVVLRVDSGGGSAQASELIWRAVAELVARKPVIVSMSDVAASGGYYIACGATKIFALDDTLTGSIGVVGGKLAPAAGLAKLGVASFPVGRGKRALMMHGLGPWTADERQAIQASMEAVYGVFVGRVADGRHKSVGDIKQIAEGRVWTGAKAKELGLVDAIGGLDAALAEARGLAKLDPASALEVYPPTPNLRDIFAGLGAVHLPLGLDGALASLHELSPEVADAAEHLVSLVLSFQ